MPQLKRGYSYSFFSIWQVAAHFVTCEPCELGCSVRFQFVVGLSYFPGPRALRLGPHMHSFAFTLLLTRKVHSGRMSKLMPDFSYPHSEAVLLLACNQGGLPVHPLVPATSTGANQVSRGR